MKDERKAFSVKLTEQQNQAVEKWMTETSCSRQVAITGLLVKGAKELGVWDDEPRERASHSVRMVNHSGICSTNGEGTGTRSGSTTSNENIKTENETSGEADSFSEFWYSIPKPLKNGTREEAKRKWYSKKVSRELLKSGLTPADVADRYVGYFKASKGEGYAGIRYVKHVSNWLDAFGFHDETSSEEDVINKSHYDMDLT